MAKNNYSAEKIANNMTSSMLIHPGEMIKDEIVARISCSGLRWIRSRYSVDDQVTLEDLPEYTVDIPVDLVK